MCSTEHGSPVPLDRLEDEITTLAGHLNAATCRWLSCAAAQLDVANRAHTGRYLVYYHDDDGSLVIEARLPVDEGELVLAALTAAGEGAERRPPAAATMAARATATTPATATMAATAAATATATLAGPTARVSADAPSPCADTDRPCAAPAGNVSAETPSPPQARADALVALAEATLEHTPSPRAGGARHEVLLLVDHETLRGDAPGRCGVGDGESLAPETARRLACDASVVPIRTRSGRPLDVGRRTRSIPPTSGARSPPATAAAASRGAVSDGSSTPTTSCTGPAAARPTSPTSSSSAATTTASSTRAVAASARAPAGSRSTDRAADESWTATDLPRATATMSRAPALPRPGYRR